MPACPRTALPTTPIRTKRPCPSPPTDRDTAIKADCAQTLTPRCIPAIPICRSSGHNHLQSVRFENLSDGLAVAGEGTSGSGFSLAHSVPLPADLGDQIHLRADPEVVGSRVDRQEGL